MSVALSDEHQALAAVARSFLADAGGVVPARETIDATDEKLPAIWDSVATLGWTGIHIPESYGGQGYGLIELAVIVEELGRVVSPGPFLPTALAAAVLVECGTDEQRQSLLPGLADGSKVAAVALGGTLGHRGGHLDGNAGAVLGAGLADVLLLATGDDLVIVPRTAEGLTVERSTSLDLTRRSAAVSCAGVAIGDDAVLRGARRPALRLGRVLAAAEASGLAHACTELAVEYAKDRQQFGRTIGTFQAVKHHCANMLVDAELATALTWDAALTAGTGPEADLAAAAAATQALPGALRNAQRSIQLHGGIGFTWEHDAHLYFRRANTLAALFGGNREAPSDVATFSRAGVRRRVTVELPPEAEGFRADARAFRERYESMPEAERATAYLDSGYLMPHFPPPYGRSAGAVEQLVIDEELDGLPRPQYGIGTWIIPTLIQTADADQVKRWIRPSLEGELLWCQLFSEPNAGSDAAAIRTKAVKTDGGWLVTGQKVWTSGASACNRGLATVRTDPDAPKHAGVTMMVLDMHAPGIDIRPLREITGDAMFNEVFFDDVFVPDEDVVGKVGAGWAVARATLGNERVSIGKGSYPGFDSESLVELLERYAPDDDGLARDLGRLLAEEQSMQALNLRLVQRAITGQGPGPEGNVTKLLSAEHAQRVTELGLTIAGPALTVDAEPALSRELLFTRCLSIAGGTSEITRNQIAERLLGLPRDPLIR